jgi:hypothetical protein
LKLKLKGHHFDITEVIEAEWQAVLNTLTEHTASRMHFKIGRRAGNGAYSRKGTASKAIVGIGPKVSF